MRRRVCRARYGMATMREARTGMAWASLLGGLALANAGLGVVHGFAAPIGGMFDAPHGAVCAALLPAGMRANIAALRERDPQRRALERYREIARILTGDPRTRCRKMAREWVGSSDGTAGDSFACGLWNRRAGRAGAGRESRPREQHEGESDCAYASGAGGSD